MKIKISILLGFLIIGFSCKKNDVNENTPFNISIDIPNDFILNDQILDVLVHNSNGLMIDRMSNLKNRMNYDFLLENETNPVFLSFVIKYENQINTYRIETFIIKETIIIPLGAYENLNIKADQFYLEYDKDEATDFVTSVSLRTRKSPRTRLVPRFFPTNEIVSFEDIKSGSRKFITLIDPQPNETYALNDFESIEIKDSFEYQVKGDGNVYSVLFGKRENIDLNYIEISNDWIYANPLIKHYLPGKNISDFLLWNELDGVDHAFGSYKLYSKFDFAFTKPEIDFSLNQISTNNINITNTDGDFFEIYLLNSSSSEYSLRWNIHGTADQKIEFKIPNLDDYMFEHEANYIPSNLRNAGSTIFKAHEKWSYNQFILFSLEGPYLFDIPSSIDYVRVHH